MISIPPHRARRGGQCVGHLTYNTMKREKYRTFFGSVSNSRSDNLSVHPSFTKFSFLIIHLAQDLFLKLSLSKLFLNFKEYLFTFRQTEPKLSRYLLLYTPFTLGRLVLFLTWLPAVPEGRWLYLAPPSSRKFPRVGESASSATPGSLPRLGLRPSGAKHKGK